MIPIEFKSTEIKLSESPEKESSVESESTNNSDLKPTEMAGQPSQSENADSESGNDSVELGTVEDGLVEHQPTGPAGHRENPEQAKSLALAAAKVCFDNFSKDVVVMDMTGKTALFDYFVVATGTSRRHLHAISEEIDDVLEKKLNDKRMSREGYEESRWIVLDYGSVVIHLFDEETRQYYSLEVLHADAPKLDISHLAPKPGKTGTDE